MKDEAGTKITYTGFRVEDPEKYDYGNICSTAKVKTTLEPIEILLREQK